MEASQIITNLYQQPEISRLIKRITPNAEDVKQDMIIVLLSKPSELIIELHNKQTLLYYAYAVASNIVKANHRRSMKMKVVELCDTPEVIDCEPQDDTDAILTRFNEIEKDGFPYYTKLIEAVALYGSQRKAAKVTGIPLNKVNEGVQQVRKYLSHDN